MNRLRLTATSDVTHRPRDVNEVFFVLTFADIPFWSGSTESCVSGTPSHGTDTGETQPTRSTYRGTKHGATPEPRIAVQSPRCRVPADKVIAASCALSWLLN